MHLPPSAAAAAHTAHLLAALGVLRLPSHGATSSCSPSGSSGMHLAAASSTLAGVLRHASSSAAASHCRQLHTGLIFLLESPPRVLRHASSALPLAPAAHRAHLLCWRAPLESSGMHHPPSHCRQLHTGLIFLLESALGVLRHASSALPLPPAAHTAHLLAGERPWGPQACVFRPPTAASGTHGSSSCWRAPLGSSGMRLPPSHCRQLHTGLIFLLESPPRVLRHASSALPLAPAAHRAKLLAKEPTQGPQSCIFRPPTGASGTQGSSSLLESAVGVLRHASSALPLPPAAHRAHLLAGERPWGPQACVFRPPTAASGTQGSSSCWRAPLGFLGMRLSPSHCRQLHTGLIFLLESALGVLRHASSALPLPPAAHTAHLLAGERPWGPQACVFRPPTAASCTQGSSSCWRAHPGSSGMHLPHSHWRQRHTGLNFLLKSPPRVLRHASSALPLAPAAHRAHLLCWRAPLESSGMHHPPSHCLQRHTGLIFLLESALGVLRHASSALPLPPAAHRAHLLAGERPWGS